MSLAHADFGTLQLVDPVDGSLRIMAHSGFGSEFTEHFARVDTTAACGRAAERRRRVVICA